LTPFELIHLNNKTGELKASAIGNAIKNSKPLPLKNGSILIPCNKSNNEVVDLFLNNPPDVIYKCLKNKQYLIVGTLNNIRTSVKISHLAKLTNSARTKFKMDIYQAELIDRYMKNEPFVMPDELEWDVSIDWKRSICATAEIINTHYHNPELQCITYHPIITRIRNVFKNLTTNEIQTFARWNAADAWLINNNAISISDVPDTTNIKTLVNWMDQCFDAKILIPLSFKKTHQSIPTLEVINPRDLQPMHIEINQMHTLTNSLVYTVNSKLYTMQFRHFSKGHNIQASIKDNHVYHGKLGFTKLLEFLDIPVPSIKNMIVDNANIPPINNWLGLIQKTQAQVIATIFQEFTKYDQGVNTLLEVHRHIMGLHICCCKILKVS
jgi:hypothetical protein